MPKLRLPSLFFTSPPMRSISTVMLGCIFAILSLNITQAIAQPGLIGTCGERIQIALQTAGTVCESTGRNQACYGNSLGAVSMRDSLDTSPWVNVGDLADLSEINSLTLSPMNEKNDQWGVALMQMQANLPDTMPGQNVTVVLFGDVILEDAVTNPIQINGVALTDSNIRLTPNRNSRLIGAVSGGEILTFTGQAHTLTGETWLQLKYDGYRTHTGWILASLITMGDSVLPIVAEDSLVYGAMQAFYFKSGLGMVECAEFPSNGIILQTPESAGLVSLNINGINLLLGSTLFLTEQPSDTGSTLSITLLEGSSLVESAGDERILIPGSQTSVALDRSGHAIGVPTAAIDYIPTMLEPYRLMLLRLGVTLPPPAGAFDDQWDSDLDGDFGVVHGNNAGGNETNPHTAHWRDNGKCNNPPPAHSHANGWHNRCDNKTNQGGNGHGGGKKDKDDDDDDDD